MYVVQERDANHIGGRMQSYLFSWSGYDVVVAEKNSGYAL